MGPSAPSSRRYPSSPESGSRESSASIRGIAWNTGSHRSGRHGRLTRMPIRKTTSSPSWSWVLRSGAIRDILGSLDSLLSNLGYQYYRVSRSRGGPRAHLRAGPGDGRARPDDQVLPARTAAAAGNADLRDPGAVRSRPRRPATADPRPDGPRRPFDRRGAARAGGHRQPAGQPV